MTSVASGRHKDNVYRRDWEMVADKHDMMQICALTPIYIKALHVPGFHSCPPLPLEPPHPTHPTMHITVANDGAATSPPTALATCHTLDTLQL